MSVVETMIDIPMEHEKNVCGQFDFHLKKIERTLHVTIVARDGAIKLIGPEQMIAKAKSVFGNLVELSKRGNTITEQNVDYALSLSFSESDSQILEIDKDIICRTVNGKPVKPKTLGQKQYVDMIRSKMIVFGIGPAGTGKTYLAMAMAIQAFKNGDVGRIILTRPAIEAGERLGFLPGDLQSKIDPYLRPLYDALYQIMGADSYLHNSEKGLIEVAPLAYMRGRTLDNAFIILDEAQNTTPAQMKMFLTRIGFGSKVIITGDKTQKDLAAGATSGLDMATRVLGHIDDIAFCNLTSSDVVRHPLVQKIVEAYDEYERKEEHQKARKRVREKEYGKDRVNDRGKDRTEDHRGKAGKGEYR
ncbi:MAG: PhoH family protein [Clostridiales bacterium]|nr:PhoH family protein [Clostridiales bacterium]